MSFERPTLTQLVERARTDVDARLLVRGAGDDPARWAVDGRRRLWFLPPDGAWSLLDTPPVTSLVEAG